MSAWFRPAMAADLSIPGMHAGEYVNKPQELSGLLSQHGLHPGAIRGMLPIWLSP